MTTTETEITYAVDILGQTTVYETYADAIAAVCSIFSDPVVGHSGDIDDGGERTLVWADEAAAENDDGSRAISAIQKHHHIPE